MIQDIKQILNMSAIYTTVSGFKLTVFKIFTQIVFIKVNIYVKTTDNLKVV